MATVTKPVALDETLQSTNTALTAQSAKLNDIIAKLQLIATALGNPELIGDTDISGIADGTITGAIAEIDGAVSDLSSAIKNKSYLLTNDFVKRNNNTTNIFDKYNGITYGGLLLNNTGTLYKDNNYCYSDFINVDDNTAYTINKYPAHICYYDSDKTYLSGKNVISDATKAFITPNDCVYIRISIQISDLDTIQLQIGSDATPYVPYYVNEVTSEDITISQLARNFCKINLFNPYAATKGGVIYSATGKFIASPIHFYSDYIPIESETVYQFMQVGQLSGFNMHVAFFDENKEYISGQSNSQYSVIAIQSPQYAAYLVFSGLIEYIDTTIVYRRNSVSYVISANDFEPYYISEKFNENRFSGKKVYFVGDSITFGVGVSDYVSDKNKLLESYTILSAILYGCTLN